MTSPLLIRSSWRFFSRHPWQLWLTLLSIALGTAVIVAVDLANQSAGQSFRRSVNVLSGDMTHEITALRGGISTGFYRQLRVDWGYRMASPQVEVVLSQAGVGYTLLGFDPFAAPLQQGVGKDLPTSGLTRLLVGQDSILVPAKLAGQLKASPGQALSMDYQGKPIRLQVAAVVGLPDAPGHMLFADLATVLAVTGQQQAPLTRIQLKLTAGEAQALQARLPTHLKLASFESRQQVFTQMTQAFSTNLLAMSLLAMLVGAFLVYNTMTFSVLQRRQGFAIGRMVGVTGGQLFRHLLLEALVLGLVGSLLGVILGVVLGQGLLVLVTQTISDLFVQVSASDLLITPLLALKGMGITLLSVVIATLAPAWEAARVAPAQVHRPSSLEQGSRSMGAWLAVAGVVLAVASIGLVQYSGHSLILGFLGLFVLILGYGLCVPLALRLGLRALQRLPWLQAALLPRMAIRSVQASLSRTALAVIALTVAVSATVGVSIMIGSFRSSVADWLDVTLSSDLYLSASHGQLAQTDGGLLSPQWLQKVANLPGVASVSTGRMQTLELDKFPLPVLVLEPGQHSQKGFEFLDGDADAIWQQFLHGEGMLVSEPFAYHRHKRRGDKVSLHTELQGEISVPILGIFRDYSATQGMATLPRVLFDRYWADRSRSSIGLKLEPDADPDAISQQLMQWAPMLQTDGSVLDIRSNRDIRQFSLQIFDRTFAITNVLRLLVIIVAFVGVFSALMALFLEKGREFAILRATGFTPQQLRWLVAAQAVLIGLLAGLLALPLGWVMSGVLIDIINQRSFGWTMQTHFFPLVLVQAVLLALVAALLASLYPVRRIGQMPVRQGLGDIHG